MDGTTDALEILIGTSVAICLGALVGLERQVSEGESGGAKDFPGVRTFAFTALLGALAVLVSNVLTPWMGIAVFLATTAFLVMRYRYDVSTRADPGFTTETAALCIFVVGALAQANQLLVATIITIAMVTLLRFKRALHRTGALLEPKDMEALIRFLVITGIVLPLLPDEPLDLLYGVLRPRDVWRMVVLISGLSFAAYVLMRFRRGPRAIVISGLLAGLVSSTAAVVAYARAARESDNPQLYETMAALATSTSFVRISLMVLLVAPQLLPGVILPLGTMFVVGLLFAMVRHVPEEMPLDAQELRNPLALQLALTFAGIYAAVLVLVAAARDLFGNSAVYAIGALAAIAGADAPTLSLARLTLDGKLEPATAACGIVIVAIASTLWKCWLSWATGGSGFVRRLAPTFLAVASAGMFYAYWYIWGARVLG